MKAVVKKAACIVAFFALSMSTQVFADSNTSTNANLDYTTNHYNPSQTQGQGQGQGQTNDSHNTAIAAPTQNNVAVGGQSGPLVIDSHAKSTGYTTFGPAANAIRSGDCAGDADGISLFSFMAGLGWSHSEESKICRTNQTIEMTCQNARSFVETGAILAQNNNLSVAGNRILNVAIDMVELCMQGLKANPINLELRAAYGKNFYVPPVTVQATTSAPAREAEE